MRIQAHATLHKQSGNMTLADIKAISAPSTAEAGERVNISVSIKSLYNGDMGIMVGGALEYGVIPWPQITFPSNQATFPPWGYFYFDGYFNMPYYPPGKVIKIHAYSYWYGRLPSEYWDSWHFDDEMVKSITIAAPVPEPSPEPEPPPLVGWLYLTTRHIAIKRVEAIIGWLYLTTRHIAIKMVEPIVGWLYLTTSHISIEKKEPVIDWLYLTTRHIQVNRKGVIPPEEEVKFPWGAAALVGGGAVALVAAAKAKKRKP